MAALTMAADGWASRGGDPATAAAARAAAEFGAPRVLAGYALLAANLELSALLYSNGVDYGTIFLALAATWAGSWWLLDRTRQGAALAVLCALGAPAAELVLMSALGSWHYSRPDVLGAFVSWVPCCYGMYVPLLVAFTRFLAAPQGAGQQLAAGAGAGTGGAARR